MEKIKGVGMSLPQAGRQRVVIENITPEIDGGRFPIKRTVGDIVTVQADVFADGHDEIAVLLLYRNAGENEWSRVQMRALGNDRWQGEFPVRSLGVATYTVWSWVNHFGTWQRDLLKRLDAQQDVRVELQTGVRWLTEAAAMARAETRKTLLEWSERLPTLDIAGLREMCQNGELKGLMSNAPGEEYLTRSSQELQIIVDRERARFSSWYEMFPRSAASEPGRHGTLRDVMARLPYVAEMGFDVLYLPPIHPIGVSYRKGRNNSVTCEAGDVGSPWAIGGKDGGHKSILAELGTVEDLDALVAAAGQRGIEIALDIAFQCAPDHPYVAAHPEWFRIRPDGTIQYAENPPKKYQDIYPLNFESVDWQGLWVELKSIFEFWIGHGIKIFRVDNPHTKAFPFWEWCIGELKQQWPDLIFLSEAFTRPKVMYRLAKLGFSQSYTYFAWRQNRWDLTQYVSEITTGQVAEFFRPNFWPNTPDILTEELQHGGRSAFIRRVVLAATLSSNYGIYGPPYEHGWCVAAKPGSEEYLNSEKYEVHYHDLNRPDSLKGLISQLNRIRRENVALQFNTSLKFHHTDNEQLLCYSKMSADRTNVIVVVVNLDGQYRQSGFVELPLSEWGLDDSTPYQMHDLLTDARYMWYGSRNYVELDPQHPVHVFRIRRRVNSGNERVYFE